MSKVNRKPTKNHLNRQHKRNMLNMKKNALTLSYCQSMSEGLVFQNYQINENMLNTNKALASMKRLAGLELTDYEKNLLEEIKES